MFHIKKGKYSFKDQIKKFMKFGRNDKILSIIKDDNPANLTDSSGKTLLHLAARCDNTEMISYLIANSLCDVDVKDELGRTPLIIATKSENNKSIELLINLNADIHWTDSRGDCALKIAINRQQIHDASIEVFLKKVQADTSTKLELVEKLVNYGCFLYQVVYLKDVEATRMFAKKKFDVKIEEIFASIEVAMVQIDCANLAYLAFYQSDYPYYTTTQQFMQYLCSARDLEKAQIRIFNQSRIIEAFEIFAEKIIEWELLPIIAEQDELKKHLYDLFENSDNEIVQIFLKSDIVPYMKNIHNIDLRIRTAANPNLGASELAELDVRSVDECGRTALYIACRSVVPKNVKFFLDKGADPNAENVYGVPIAFSFINSERINEKRECLMLLLKYGLDIQVCKYKSKLFVEFAIQNDCSLIGLEPALAELAMLKVLGVPVNRLILMHIKSKIEWKNCYDTFVQQVKKINKISIFGSFTLLTLLRTRYNRLPAYLRAQIGDICRSTRDIDFLRDKESYFTLVLKQSLDDILMMIKVHRLREEAKQVIRTNIEIFIGYEFVLDTIVQYLNYYDLLVFE